MTMVLLLVGGILGALGRYHATRIIHGRWDRPYPLATTLINITGSCALGALYGLVGAQPTPAGQLALLVLGTGFCGAFTTFSSFAFETVQLWRVGHSRGAFVNVVAQMLVGLLAAWIGMWAMTG